MPIYESEELTREDLDKIRRRGKCSVCGARLNCYLDPESGKVFVACWDWLRTHHDGIEREASEYEKKGMEALTLKARREIVSEQVGKEKTTALSRYIGTGIITRKIATEIVETLWGKAPPVEKTKAILLCQTYQLNPLMKHVYLVGYKRKVKDSTSLRDKNGYAIDQDGKLILDWSMMIGIGATRLMAQRKHNYRYMDLTPRKATKEEIEKILGDTADRDSVYGFVHIKDVATGAEAYGLRGCNKYEKIKGAEKGNTHLNQACVRAERLALDRQYPGEMPPNIEAVDERYIDAEYTVLDEATGEITEGAPEIEPEPEAEPELEPEPEPEPTSRISPPDEHWCQEHNCAFELKKSRFGSFYSHKLPGGGYCKEGKQKEAQPVAAKEEAQPRPERDPDTLRTLNDLFRACNEDFKLQPNQVIAELGFSSQTDISDTPALCYQKIKAVRE